MNGRMAKWNTPEGKREREDMMIKVHDLHLSGMRFDQIGRELGIAPTTAASYYRKMVDAAIAMRGEDLLKSADDRLDMLTVHARGMLYDDDPKIRLAANAQMLRIEESRRKLHGIDQPDKVTVTPAEESEEEKALKEMIKEQRRKNQERMEEVRGEAKHE